MPRPRCRPGGDVDVAELGGLPEGDQGVLHVQQQLARGPSRDTVWAGSSGLLRASWRQSWVQVTALSSTATDFGGEAVDMRQPIEYDAGSVAGNPKVSNSSVSKNAITCWTRPSTSWSTCSWNGSKCPSSWRM